MDAVDVIAVVGACVPERLRYAKRLAALTSRTFIPAAQLAGSPDPVEEAAVLASWSDAAAGTVLEIPVEVPVTELIGALVGAERRTRLLGLVCVVDAVHLFDDLQCDDYLPMRDRESGIPAAFAARAQLTVTQIEYASTIVLVNWAPLPTEELATAMALLNHLSPHARLRLHRDAIQPPDPVTVFTPEQSRIGWVGVLNGDFEPYMTDRRVSVLRYEQIRPLHPGRLMGLLDDQIESGAFGTIVRSAGFCRLATRPNIVAQWEHVGRVISLSPLAVDERLSGDDELLSLGQDLAIVGLDLDRDALSAAFDEAALTDEELAAGPTVWAAFSDPFPTWLTAGRRSE